MPVMEAAEAGRKAQSRQTASADLRYGARA